MFHTSGSCSSSIDSVSSLNSGSSKEPATISKSEGGSSCPPWVIPVVSMQKPIWISGQDDSETQQSTIGGMLLFGILPKTKVIKVNIVSTHHQSSLRKKWFYVILVKWPIIFTCKHLLVSFLQLIPVKSFTHLCNNLSTDVCGKSVRLWRVREVADPSSKLQNKLKLTKCTMGGCHLLNFKNIIFSPPCPVH